MTIKQVAPLPASYTETTTALHRLAVYVIAPAQRLANGEIILRATPGGFSTFPYDGHVVGVDGDQLVVDGTRSPITTLNAAAAAIGIAPDVTQQEQFDVPPHGDLDEPLDVDPAAAHALGDWYAFATEVLDTLRAEAEADDDASIVRIWPEHFDAAIDMGDGTADRRGTYGASPGDRTTPGRTSTYRRGRAGSTASSTIPRSTAPPCCASGSWMIPTRPRQRSASCARPATGSAGVSETAWFQLRGLGA